MATVPLSGTNIRLLSNVPFSNDYKNTRWFDAKTDQTNYFTAKPVTHSIHEANFQRIEGYHYIAVNKSIDELWGTNYLMFQNAQYNSKWFYAFVTKLEYKQRNTTWVHFQIDVFQTWKFDMNFKPSFVMREHCKLWNSDGTPVINTVDEGIHYGADYETVSVQNYSPYGAVYFLVIVTKDALHNGISSGVQEREISPTINGIPQPLCYYIHPFMLGSAGIVGIKVGGGVRFSNGIRSLLKSIYTNEHSVNNVVSLYVTEYFGLNTEFLNYDSGTNTMEFSGTMFEQAIIADDGPNGINTVYAKDIFAYNTLTKSFGDKYSDFRKPKESKLLMYPYSLTLLDDGKGNRTTIKNEYIQDKNLQVGVKGSLGTSNKVSYNVRKYLQDVGEDHSLPLELENALINKTPNDIPIVNDYLSSYLQGNRNSIENQKAMINWNSAMSQVGSAIGGTASGMSGNGFGVASAVQSMVGSEGNRVLQLQGIQAKIKDIDNTPPSLAKLGSNTNFDYGNGLKGVYVIKKQIVPEYERKLTHFFNMFGYKLNEVKVPNFHTRKYWNYIQTSGCNITGNFNNDDLQELKNVFDSGITLWHTDDVGNYSLDNEVIA